ncbi:Cph1 family holin [Lachnotalea glycerini]|uniref:Holin n=1 Tax=Lachnotalea glycerini TaxID=1763509 RepID=A0A255IIB7_9FIRM|nr:phage holin family protein [Lachnotalea glycerini]PXV86253.1 Cph1 family holin [Lachnotalea glycerini]RDY31574.1 holin [Lachnotalea glycerini]
MNYLIDYGKLIVAFLGRILGWVLGGLDALIYALIVFIIIDYITGIMLAIKNKTLSSEVGYKGIIKKILILIIVSMGNIMDNYILNTGSTLRTLIIMFYLANEGISILENAGILGLAIPQKLKDAIQKLSSDT